MNISNLDKAIDQLEDTIIAEIKDNLPETNLISLSLKLGYLSKITRPNPKNIHKRTVTMGYFGTIKATFCPPPKENTHTILSKGGLYVHMAGRIIKKSDEKAPLQTLTIRHYAKIFLEDFPEIRTLIALENKRPKKIDRQYENPTH